MRKLLWLLWLFLLGICDAQVTPHMALNLASHDTAGWDVLLNNNFTALDTSLGGLVACSTNQAGGFNGTAWMCTAFPTGPPTVVATRSQLVSNGVSQNGVYQTKPVLDARDFSGANAGAQIQAAHDSSNCPSTGCVIDARGFGATDTIAGLTITKPVEIDFGATTYSVTATMTIGPVIGVRFTGSSSSNNSQTSGTRFIWAGGSAQIIRLISVAKADFRDFFVGCSTAVPCTSFFTSERGASGNPTDNHFTNVTGDGTNGGVTNGFDWIVGAGGDNGNDHFEFGNVEFDNYSNAAWYNTSTQSQIHTFLHCSCNSNGYGKYCYQGTGSFAAYNMVETTNTVVDFAINPNNGVLISGGISIGSTRFYSDGVSANTYPVTIQGVNFSAYNLNADGKVIIIGQAGPYLIENNEISGLGYSTTIPVQFNYDGNTTSPVAIGNNMISSLPSPFTGNWYLLNNSTGDGPPSPVPDVFPNGLNGTAYLSVGTTFTSSAGCSETSLTGGATAGFFLAGATSCTTTVKMGHSATAPNGWACSVWDMTTTADVMKETASTTTTVTFSGTVAPSDKIIFGCIGF
jgi:hypothetical protein